MDIERPEWNEVRKGFPMELLIMAGVVGAWILLNAVILPRLGVPT